MKFRVLIAEDEEISRKHLVSTLADEGYEVFGSGDGMEALRMMQNQRFDVLIADIRMPGMSGLELLAEVRKRFTETEVIIVTGFGSIGSAVEAMKQGAVDYVPKPFDLDEIVMKVRRIHDRRILLRENLALKVSVEPQKDVSLIAESASMKAIVETVRSISDSSCTVLLTGESGVGKNLLAKVIHFTSPRREMPFLAVNCATFTEELLASELFGHEKGAFTGAIAVKKGLVEIADTGAIFLDEIAEMPPNLQAKLLKVIEDQEFYRVGGTKPIRVDVRFIASTNQSIRTMIAEGTFRKDLYYRLNVMEIAIPPLRERRKDIEPLSRYFLERHCLKYKKPISGFTREALKVLHEYSYPGNVRELENIIERAIILEKSKSISPENLPHTINMFKFETLEPDGIKSMDEISRQYARSVVETLGGNKAEAARVLGISRTSLWRILKD